MTCDRSGLRARLLQRLAEVFSHPSAALHSSLADQTHQREIGGLFAGLLGRRVSLPEIANDREGFEAGYIRLFQIGRRGAPLVGLHAGDYDGLRAGRPRTELMLDCGRWYRHFGVRVSGRDASTSLPDHLVCQLEFLGWLSHLEADAEAGSPARAGYLRAQRDFADRYTEPFLALVAGRLAALGSEPAEAPVFTAFAQLALSVVSAIERPVIDAHDEGGHPPSVVDLWS